MVFGRGVWGQGAAVARLWGFGTRIGAEGGDNGGCRGVVRVWTGCVVAFWSGLPRAVKWVIRGAVAVRGGHHVVPPAREGGWEGRRTL